MHQFKTCKYNEDIIKLLLNLYNHHCIGPKNEYFEAIELIRYGGGEETLCISLVNMVLISLHNSECFLLMTSSSC